jgi:hypothetical protein
MEHFKTIGVDPIPNGQKFVALYADGSGARLCWISNDGNLMDYRLDTVVKGSEENIEEFLQGSGYLYWMPLPDSFEFWGEHV